ncbi:hypothetical protein MMC21_006150 [Puttea exsequens]|nr:hypothetical protein [Puttea exsequens]
MAQEEADSEQGPFPWHLGIFDAHCHPTDTVPSIKNIADMKTRALIIMATRAQDQSIVADFADKLGITMDMLNELRWEENNNKPSGYIVPSFGWHPWFSHHLYDDLNDDTSHKAPPGKATHYMKALTLLPENDESFVNSLPNPWPLSEMLEQTRQYLARYPLAIVGEIGLDRAFRVPGIEMPDESYRRDSALTPGGREGRRLSPYRVDMEHQRVILKAQLDLAGKMQRAVSIHGVAAHGMVFETLQETWQGFEKPVVSKRDRKRRGSIEGAHDGEENVEQPKTSDAGTSKPFPPRICLHSYSGPPDTVKQYLHPSVPAVIFFSFSKLVNFSSRTNKAVAAITAIPADRILAESDLHAAGDAMDNLLEDIVRKICKIKHWSLEDGVKQLSLNWMHYAFGRG